ncbi:SDR family oxidoreductase [Rhodococcus sp. NPDC058514]|uniref:SDR family oxidoreductase n=1 Tax=unclassified Rhodococcus (in: high G+C Gram-positive bacteria) TaxID=192944 RepID=UPI0036526FDC
MTILVTGATANIGRLVVDHLLEAGASDVRALTNNPRRAGLPEGVEVAEGYLRRPESLPSAFEGVERMYLAPTPETVDEVMALAREAGVRHIVDLSGEPESWWGAVTLAVERSGIDWTHLWAGEFLENYLVWGDQVRRTGQVRDPFPDVVSAPIAMDDIARVAASVLLGDGHAGQTYELTGPEAHSRAERVAELGAEFVRVPSEAAIEILEPVMGENARFYIESAVASLVGAPQQANAAVEEITGRPATTFAQWAAANADTFRQP